MSSHSQVAHPQAGKLVDVKLPEGYMLVLTGYTLEHVTCVMFKAAPHNVVVSDPAIKRLSFAYKLRCPTDGVVTQYNKLSANSKLLDQKHMKGTTVEELMRQFDQQRVSINRAGADLVRRGLSPEWQHAVTEWCSTRHSVDDEWIWHRLISTMGWQPPDWGIPVKLDNTWFTLMVHDTWTGASLESILEIVHGMVPPDFWRVRHGISDVVLDRTLREQNITKHSTLELVGMLLGD